MAGASKKLLRVAGLPAATRKACEELVTIPGSGRVQSLNAAASAAMRLHAFSDHASGS